MTATTGLWCVIPVKRREHAKQRLAPVLDPRDRALLAQAMLRDVLAAVKAVPGLAGVTLVTADPLMADLGRGAGASLLPDVLEAGIGPAVELAAAWLPGRRASGLLILPSDVPGVTPGEIAHLVASHGRGRAVTVVPAARDGGTNALAVSPADAVPPCFGERSAVRHWSAARQAGIAARTLPLPGLAHDLDRPEDLDRFHAAPGRTLTRALLDDLARAGRWPAPGLTAASRVNLSLLRAGANGP